MNPPHTRPDRFRMRDVEGGIPAGHARALHRRHALEAQQRAYRHIEAEQPAATPADLAPVRRRMGGGRTSG